MGLLGSLRLRAWRLSLFLTAVGLFASAAYGENDFPQSAMVARCETDLGSNVTYRMVYDKLSRHILADLVMPEYDINRRVIVGFYKGHPYVHYKNHRFDSSGLGGVHVSTSLHESTELHGEMAAIIYDLSDDAVARLDREIAEFKSRSHISCVSAVCRYVRMAEPDASLIPRMGPTALINDLLAHKARGGNVEFIMLNGTSMDVNRSIIEENEKKFKKSYAFLGGLVTAVAVPFGSFFIKLILN